MAANLVLPFGNLGLEVRGGKARVGLNGQPVPCGNDQQIAALKERIKP
jgi:hypothetical protein